MYYTSNTNPRKLEIHFYLKDVVLHYLQSTTKQKIDLITVPEVDGKRPFQHVEKTCSIIMALLFLLFNALYWPWLLKDEDFDYAKFAATQQSQLKI